MKRVLALVDYDNVMSAEEKNKGDTAANIYDICSIISRYITDRDPSVEEVNLRLYGGWVDLSMRETVRASWLLAEISAFRTRINKIRFKPSIVRDLIDYPTATLIGTYQNKEQKMVDAMISFDLLSFSKEYDGIIILFSDDTDFVPALLLASVEGGKKRRIHLIRRFKETGVPPNDRYLIDAGITINKVS